MPGILSGWLESWRFPDPATSNLLTQVINLKECPFYMLRNQNGVTIATINADTGEII
jgi:hypothetical protein